MTVTSFGFFVFLGFGVLVYYLVPKQAQWVLLLVMSLVFFHFAAPADYAILFPLLSTMTACLFGRAVADKDRALGEGAAKALVTAAVVFNILIWFLLKGSPFWAPATILLHRVLPAFPQVSELPIAGALGMGYYTAQVIAYIMDCYRGTITPQKNFFKLFLFVTFFPQLTVGPISRHPQLESLYEQHKLKYINLCHGTQRILWGLFKKLVISDRLGIPISSIWSDALPDKGLWPVVAMLLYPLQIYTDFSGCMDIILGAAELFDIHMPENFRNPFFSRTVQEFWQRWHITLGAWARDYVYYPVLKSRALQSLGRWSKKHFNKRLAKFIPWAAGMAVLWFVMGFWHGSGRHILGVGVYFWTVLVVGEWLSPLFKACIQKLHINTKSAAWHVFQSIRTYLVFALGETFFSADDLRTAFQHFGILFGAMRKPAFSTLFDGRAGSLGITAVEVLLLIFSVAILSAGDAINEKTGSLRGWVDRQNIFVRWTLYIGLFFGVALCGMYGPEYNEQAFIYGDF